VPGLLTFPKLEFMLSWKFEISRLLRATGEHEEKERVLCRYWQQRENRLPLRSSFKHWHKVWMFYVGVNLIKYQDSLGEEPWNILCSCSPCVSFGIICRYLYKHIRLVYK
jgi:hypothetical protein